jgi:hypothetical protein
MTAYPPPPIDIDWEWRDEKARRTRARQAVTLTIHHGHLVPAASCEACGAATAKRFHYHHHSYAVAYMLDVIPLCVTCHRRLHWGHVVEPRTGRLYAAAGIRAEQARNRRDAHAAYLTAHATLLVFDGKRWPWHTKRIEALAAWLAAHPDLPPPRSRPRSWTRHSRLLVERLLRGAAPPEVSP